MINADKTIHPAEIILDELVVFDGVVELLVESVELVVVLLSVVVGEGVCPDANCWFT